jgi:hypothetical protein
VEERLYSDLLIVLHCDRVYYLGGGVFLSVVEFVVGGPSFLRLGRFSLERSSSYLAG